MKKCLLILAAILSMQMAYAGDTANINIKIGGALPDNTYFLCMEDLGCLSILAAEKGKVYPIFHPIEMHNLFITDVDNNFQVSAEGLPASCNKTVQTDQTITIYGSLAKGPNNTTQLQQLHCTVS